MKNLKKFSLITAISAVILTGATILYKYYKEGKQELKESGYDNSTPSLRG